jgi:hypothetical protein
METRPQATPARRRTLGLRTDPRSRRQLAERGPILFWRDGEGRREGLACLLSACENAQCTCHNVFVTGLLIDERAIAVSGGAKSIRISWPEGSEPPRAGLAWPLRVTVDLEARTVTPRADDVPADLVEWLRAELDDVLIDLLRRRWRLAKR